MKNVDLDALKEVKYIATAGLIVDRKTYQRPLSQARIRKISSNWDPDLCLPLVVSARHGATYAVIDGGHRLGAARLRGITFLPCCVHRDLDKAEEAALFWQLNAYRKGVRNTDKFRAQIIANVELYVETLAVMNKHGLSLPRVKNDGNNLKHTTCPGSIVRIVKARGRERLETVLAIIDACWPDGEDKHQGWPMLGLSNFLDVLQQNKLNPYNKSGGLDKKLVAKMSTRPLKFIEHRAAGQNPSNPSSAKSTGDAFLFVYNWGRQPENKIYR